MELTIPATPAHLVGLRQAARHALREVPPQIAEELVLALDEAATNAILHGSRGGDPVQVAVWVRDDWVEATVVDHGPAQPPHPPPTTDQLSSHGRGLWLLDRLVDEVRAVRVARLVHQPVRVLGVPAVRAACGGIRCRPHRHSAWVTAASTGSIQG